jgi:hypothetical protein
MLQELTNKIKKTLKDKEWTRLSFDTADEDIDINLEDVLRCLEIRPSDVVLSVWRDGTMKILSYGEIFLDWKLGKPLHEQGEETIKKLNKLILI